MVAAVPLDVSSSASGGVDSTEEIDELDSLEGSGEDQYAERLIKVLLWMVQTNQESLEQFFKILADGDKNKADEMLNMLQENLKQLKKQEKMKGLKVFLKILSIFALVIASLMVLVNPTPIGIAMLVVAIGMFLEPMVSKAAGKESLINMAFKELFNALKELGMPVWMVAILMAVIVVAMVTVCAYGLVGVGKVVAELAGKAMQGLKAAAASSVAAGGTSGTSGAVVKSVESVTKMMDDMMAWIKNFITPNIKRLVAAADVTSLTAMNSGELAQGILKYQVTESQVSIDKMMALIDMIVEGLDLTRSDAAELKRMILEYVEQLERMELV